MAARQVSVRIRYVNQKFHVLIAGQKPGLGTKVVIVPGPDLEVACETARCAYDREPLLCSAS
jgi:hypothetical protein